MPRIHQLPMTVITKIAAGEVIERPASVVKELLENSIDAGSTRIDIEIEQGGAELIRIADNGCGIERDDLQLAFASHATSKLDTADDLFRVSTLGFRGEALASIGSVAQVSMQSRPAGQMCGAEISCHGGVLSPVRDWNGAPGTRIEVKHLFYNTPVRRKFLRMPGTEMGHITEIVTRIALAKSSPPLTKEGPGGLHLTLRHNSKDVHEVTATMDLLERIQRFFGAEVSTKLYAIDERAGPARIFGYIADPSCERPNARMQYFFLNGRWIRDRSLSHALQEAYRGLIMSGRYATAFLFLELPPDQVDVNVHPTKAEVRFRDGHALWNFLFGTVRNRLSAEKLTPRLFATSTLAAPFVPRPGETPGWFTPQVQESRPSLFGGPNRSTPVPEPTNGTAGFSLPHTPVAHAPGSPGVESQLPLSAPNAIQLYNAYLVLETPEGMLVIDQHALHERILFEQLKGRIREGNLETQKLLIPEPVELTTDQAARTLDSRNELAELGLVVEDFGGGTVLLSGYPALLARTPPAEILKTVVDYLTTKDRLPTREVLLNDLLSLMACHSAVRAGDSLTADEITALIAQRELADDTHHCPHGRPTALLFSKQDLDRQFRRT